ncbi:nuclear transport factor 2 family protein [Actinomadura oligospora]|uniref:nuclear transport factor 2 family protein n=1 Tax=Actinomadura oligospora TaxID=111804 RepID=UPI0004BAC2D1|nr:nuclear transport factor 2 family protein [Actinomadura oligospora]
MTPRETFDRLSQGISDGRWGELAALYAEDAVVEQPFVMPLAPSRIEGRAALAAHFAKAAQGPFRLRVENVVVHETSDPEVIAAEFGYAGELTATGAGFAMGNIQVLRVRDGLIVYSRDYHDHAALERALGAS